MSLKRFVNITPAELKAKGVVALADKPNVVSPYGAGGMSSTALKLWFDQIGKFIAEKINVIQDALSGDDAASYVKLDLSGLDPESEKIEGFSYSLQDLCNACLNGKLAAYVLAYETPADDKLKSLQVILNSIAQKISNANERLTEYKTLLKSADGAAEVGLPEKYGAGKKLADLIDDIYSCDLAAKLVVEAYGLTAATQNVKTPAALQTCLNDIAAALQAQSGSVLLDKINERYTKIAADNLFRTKEDSYTKAETVAIGVYRSEQGTQDNRLTNIEKTIGNMQGQDTDILGMIDSINEDIDSLQLGVVPRKIRGRIENANPAELSESLINALNAAVFSATGRATPDNTDAVQVIDSAMPNKGEVYTYYYWAAPESSEIDGWYVAAIYTAPSITDIPSYKFNIVASSWTAVADDDGLYYITITPEMHGMGTDLSVLVDLRIYHDGEYYANANLYFVKPNGEIVLYSDYKYVGECVVRCGKAYFSANMAVNAIDNGNGIIELGNGLKLLVGAAELTNVAAGESKGVEITAASVNAIFTATATPDKTAFTAAVNISGNTCTILCRNNGTAADGVTVNYIILAN